MNRYERMVMESDLSHYYDVKAPKDLEQYVNRQLPRYMFRLSRKNECECICSYCRTKFTKNMRTDNNICPHCHSHLIPRVITNESKIFDKINIAIAGRQKHGKSIDYYVIRRKTTRCDKGIEMFVYFERIGRTVMDMDGRRCYKWYGAYSYCDWHPIDTIWDEFYCHPSVNRLMGVKMPTNEPIAIDYYLYNLEKYPITKVLYDKGFKKLACSGYVCKDVNSKSMAEFLDVNPNMVPKLAAVNASFNLVRFVSDNNINCSLDTVKALTGIIRDPFTYDFAKNMSADKFVNYFTAQHDVTKKDYENLFYIYRDYLAMAEELNIDMSHKTNRYPRNIVTEHNRLVKIKGQIKEAELAKRQAEIFEMSNGIDDRYSNAEFCVVVPSTFDEFVVEGQSLHHCVGSSKTYFNRHCDGESLIAFIRKADNPSKPFFTLELDMPSFKIKQLYGYGDCHAPADVRKFVEAFALKFKRNIAKRAAAIA